MKVRLTLLSAMNTSMLASWELFPALPPTTNDDCFLPCACNNENIIFNHKDNENILSVISRMEYHRYQVVALHVKKKTFIQEDPELR